MMAKMNSTLREKEKKVVELTEKLKEFDGVMDKADGEYKTRLEKKNKVGQSQAVNIITHEHDYLNVILSINLVVSQWR